MPEPFSVFGSTAVPRVAKVLKGIAKRQKQEDVWDNLEEARNEKGNSTTYSQRNKRNGQNIKRVNSSKQEIGPMKKAKTTVQG
jgi:hypothetical protein